MIGGMRLAISGCLRNCCRSCRDVRDMKIYILSIDLHLICVQCFVTVVLFFGDYYHLYLLMLVSMGQYLFAGLCQL